MQELISRQAAIDALWAERMKHAEEMERNLETRSFALRADNKARRNRVEEDIEIISQLPSAQPETATVTIGKTRGTDILWYQCDGCGEPVAKEDCYCSKCGRRLRFE